MADLSRPRVLFVGSIFNRRHVPDLIRAFMPIARAHDAATLDIVGANRTHPRQDIAEVIATADVVGRVRLVGLDDTLVTTARGLGICLGD